MYLGATVPGRTGRGCEKVPLLVAVERAGPDGPGRCSVRVASDVAAGSYREFLRPRMCVLARVRFPRAELLSSTFAPQGPGRRFRNAGRERRENEAWVAAATAEATKGRVANYASR